MSVRRMSRRSCFVWWSAIVATGLGFNVADAQTIPRLAGPIEDVWTTDRPTGSWLEGPSFGGGDIWFADPGNIFLPEPEQTQLMRFSPESGVTTTAIDRAADPNIFGTAFDSQGRLLTTHLGRGIVARRDVDRLRDFEVLADGFADPVNAFVPNDLVSDAFGGTYFTSYMENAPPELGDSSVYYIDPLGRLSLATDLPGSRDANGIGLSPDGGTLYVAFPFQGQVKAYDILAVGVATNERFFAASPGGVDGITLDRHGNVYVSDLGLSLDMPVPQPDLPTSLVRVFSSAGEELLTFDPPHGAINMTITPDDTLYIAGWNTLSRVPLEFDAATTMPTTVVSPRAYTDVEGEGADTTSGLRIRGQQVFQASDFADLGPGTYRISEIAYRPDGERAAPAEATWGDLSMSLGVTTADHDAIDNTFADNYDSDMVVVKTGRVTITSEDKLSANGVTKEFDQTITLDEPYLYDPSDGNLILEVVMSEPIDRAPLIDFADKPPVAMVANISDPNAEVANRTYGGPITQFTLQRIEPGDFDGDGDLDVDDVDLLARHVAQGIDYRALDLSGDDVVDGDDIRVWATEIRRTWLGDANLDGEFDSTDLVDVFQHSEYEDGLAENSTWATGDWNGDGDFDSSDLIVAFRDGGYERGLRPAVSAVPEPSACVVLLPVCLFGFWVRQE